MGGHLHDDAEQVERFRTRRHACHRTTRVFLRGLQILSLQTRYTLREMLLILLSRLASLSLRTQRSSQNLANMLGGERLRKYTDYSTSYRLDDIFGALIVKRDYRLNFRMQRRKLLQHFHVFLWRLTYVNSYVN